MLTSIDLDDQARFKANEVDNKVLEGNLSAKLELRESPIAQQTPHRLLGVSGFAAHVLCEVADALGGRPMVRCRRH